MVHEEPISLSSSIDENSYLQNSLKEFFGCLSVQHLAMCSKLLDDWISSSTLFTNRESEKGRVSYKVFMGNFKYIIFL